MNILLIDNTDSFTYNLVDLLRSFDNVNIIICQFESLNEQELEQIDKIIFSPGPGLPEEYPEMFRLLDFYKGKKEILGICLGLQAIGIYFGAHLVNLDKVVHGQTRNIKVLNSTPLFQGLPDSISVGLYHSWALQADTIPKEIQVLAVSEEGVIMAIKHAKYSIFGVQFHPESHLTPKGRKIIENFLFYS